MRELIIKIIINRFSELSEKAKINEGKSKFKTRQGLNITFLSVKCKIK